MKRVTPLLDQLSDVLLIILNRFKPDKRGRPSSAKDNRNADYGFELKIGHRRYQLTGVGLHHGSTPNGGHWTAYVKRVNQWFNCDD